jgi:DNA replication protein DnaC
MSEEGTPIRKSDTAEEASWYATSRRKGRGVTEDLSISDLVAKARDAAVAHTEEHGEYEQKDLVGAELKRKHDRHLNAVFSKLHRRMTFPSFVTQNKSQADAKVACHSYASAIVKGDEVSGLLLSSPPGRGKTHLGVATLQAVALPERRVEVCQVPNFLAEIKAAFSTRSDADPDLILNQMKTADVLLLDDLGAERETEWAIETLYLLIDFRVQEELPTIITTNLGLTEFNQRADGEFSKNYGDDPVFCSRIYSRLRGMVVGNIHVLDGEDYRAKG